MILTLDNNRLLSGENKAKAKEVKNSLVVKRLESSEM